MDRFDLAAFQFIHRFVGHSSWLDGTAVFFAQYMPYLMVVGFLLLVIYQPGWRKKVYLFCEGVLAIILARGLVTELIRLFYHESRPFDFYGFAPLIAEGGWSFPSGHAAWFFALAMTVWYANRKWGVWYFVLAALMGAARVYTGVHWPIDIVGGAAIGIVCAIAVHKLLQTSREGIAETAITVPPDAVSRAPQVPR